MGSKQKATMRVDYPLFLAVVVLLILGLMMIYSATFTWESQRGIMIKQTAWAVLGLVLLLIAMRLDYRIWRRFALPMMGIAVLALVAVLLMGDRKGDTTSWFREGSVQPSEFAKLAFIVYMAAWLASKGEKIRDVTYGLIPFAVLLGIVSGLILRQPDIGTALLIIATAMAMFFIAGAELVQLLISLVVGGAAFSLIIMNSERAYGRIITFLNPNADPSGEGYQILRILSSLRSGGIAGRGLGSGMEKYVLPLPHTDTIFSVIGEELGLLGCLIVIGLFLFIAYRGLIISFRAPDTFSTLLAFGITCWMIFQATIHIAGNTNTLPFTGVTLPFISYGGSSLTMSLTGIGILLSISRVGVERERRTSAVFAFGRRDRRARVSRASRRGGMEKRQRQW
ncbi:MAG: cell division protein FtsW [Chloroflexi bacterium]|nr:cell division protein FtsW [Chloroflexota bacterium]